MVDLFACFLILNDYDHYIDIKKITIIHQQSIMIADHNVLLLSVDKTSMQHNKGPNNAMPGKRSKTTNHRQQPQSQSKKIKNTTTLFFGREI